MLNGLSVRQKLYTLLGLIFSAGIAMALVVLSELSPLGKAFEHTVNSTGQRTGYVDTVMTEFGYGGAIHSFKNYVLRGNDKYVERFEEAHENINGVLDKYLKVPGISPAERNAVTDIRRVIDAYQSNLSNVQRLVADGATPAAIDQVVKVSDGPAIAGIRLLADKAHTYGEVSKTEFSDMLRGAKLWVLGVLFGCLGLAVIVVAWLIASILRPMREFQAKVDDLAHGHTDLTQQLPVKGQDEFAQIATGFNLFIQKVRATVAAVSTATVSLSDSTRTMAEAGAAAHDALAKQRAELDQVATAINEMSASAQEVADSATAAAQAAEAVDHDSEQGRQVVAANVEYVNAVASEVARCSEVIGRLERDSDSIGSVLDVIRGIAEQTNLLALNAAIEAARAGEQGRGFAVVADEVRTLAQRTQESTEEIQKMIEGLQSASTEAVNVMNSGQEKVQASVMEASRVSETLEKIAAGIDTMKRSNLQIATAASQQNSVAAEVIHSLVNVSSMMDDTAASAEHSASTSNQLEEMVAKMQAQVEKYRT